MLNLVVIYRELCYNDGFTVVAPYQTPIVDRAVVLMSYLTICLSVRGLLARSVLQAQAASPIFTHVYAAVVAIINSKFPQIGELILKRLILTFRKSYRRNLKVPPACLQLESKDVDAVCLISLFYQQWGLIIALKTYLLLYFSNSASQPQSLWHISSTRMWYVPLALRGVLVC